VALPEVIQADRLPLRPFRLGAADDVLADASRRRSNCPPDAAAFRRSALTSAAVLDYDRLTSGRTPQAARPNVLSRGAASVDCCRSSGTHGLFPCHEGPLAEPIEVRIGHTLHNSMEPEQTVSVGLNLRKGLPTVRHA